LSDEKQNLSDVRVFLQKNLVYFRGFERDL